MKILVLNSGSSSFKYQLIEMPEVNVLADGLVDKIWLKWSEFSHKSWKNKIKFIEDVSDHKKALIKVLSLLTKWESSVLNSLKEIDSGVKNEIQKD